MVTDGSIRRDCKARIIRDGIVIYDGKLGSLRRFENDVKEVTSGYECGMTIENYNDIKQDDIIEAYEDQEVEQ
jgi:translation initiation factor IF-2